MCLQVAVVLDMHSPTSWEHILAGHYHAQYKHFPPGKWAHSKAGHWYEAAAACKRVIGGLQRWSTWCLQTLAEICRWVDNLHKHEHCKPGL
jgi:hypothetical protein